MPTESISFKDMHLQPFRMKVVESALDTYTEVSKNTPVTTQLPGGKALVMNLIGVYLSYVAGVSLDNGDGIELHIADRSHAAIQGMSTPGVIISDGEFYQVKGDAGGLMAKRLKYYNLSDGNGKGYIYPHALMWLAVEGTGQALVMRVDMSLLFTLTMVKAAELVGALQS